MGSERKTREPVLSDEAGSAMTVRSIDDARSHLERYTDPAGRFAWHTYDRQGDSASLEPIDCLAPALLDARVDGRTVVAMFAQDDSPERILLEALQAVLSHNESSLAQFEVQDLGADTGAWATVRAALRASNNVGGIKASKVTKMLHRKRPNLVPIFDSEVAAYYGVTPRRPWDLWPILQDELRRHGQWLDELRAPHQTPDASDGATPRPRHCGVDAPQVI